MDPVSPITPDEDRFRKYTLLSKNWLYALEIRAMKKLFELVLNQVEWPRVATAMNCYTEPTDYRDVVEAVFEERVRTMRAELRAMKRESALEWQDTTDEATNPTAEEGPSEEDIPPYLGASWFEDSDGELGSTDFEEGQVAEDLV